MESVGVMVPFLKVFIAWHTLGFIVLLLVSAVVKKMVESSA
jgi:hypothetical protein